MILERTDNLPALAPLCPPSPTDLNVFKDFNDLKVSFLSKKIRADFDSLRGHDGISA